MTITVKLFASLSRFLPAGARDNQAAIDVPAGATPSSLLGQLGVPAERAHLLLVNGAYVEPERRGSLVLHEGDVVALWPPVAGG